ncbi:hypothetical protein SPYSS1447_0452 [Streptococcus pyogenes SS1447]|nr:hypothetical protein SPYSS1447_0452 [Streptococcus pyogenes SS1447]
MRFLKLSKFRKPKALRLMSLLVASSLAFEQGSSMALVTEFLYRIRVFKAVLKV